MKIKESKTDKGPNNLIKYIKRTPRIIHQYHLNSLQNGQKHQQKNLSPNPPSHNGQEDQEDATTPNQRSKTGNAKGIGSVSCTE